MFSPRSLLLTMGIVIVAAGYADGQPPDLPPPTIIGQEQLRAIENGYGILFGKVKHTCDGIDTPEQYAEFVTRYKKATKSTENT